MKAKHIVNIRTDESVDTMFVWDIALGETGDIKIKCNGADIISSYADGDTWLYPKHLEEMGLTIKRIKT